MLDGSRLRDLIQRRLTRRGLFRAGGAGVATALIVGTGQVTTPTLAEAAALRAAALEAAAGRRPVTTDGVSAVPTLSRDEMLALDPHAFTGRTQAAPAEQGGPRVKILPLGRA